MGYKMAIIGLGGMGSWHLDNVQKRIDEITVVGAYDIRDEAIEKIKKANLTCYNSPEEIYNDKTIDLVLIATPNDTHKPYAINCLNSGKNVICEKPVTLCSADAIEILEVAKANNKFFTVHQNRRWDTDFLTVKKILSENTLTNPYIIESRVQGSRRGMFGWRKHKINGGGMVLDWGIHLMDQMLQLIDGKIVDVNAHLHTVFSDEVDDNFTAMFRFDNGCSYLVNIAMNCFITQPRWHMCCEDGTAIVEDWNVNGKVVKLADLDGDLGWEEEIVYTAAGPTRSMAPRPAETTQVLELPKTKAAPNEYYKNIIACLDGKASPIVTPEQIVRLMKLVDAVFLSHETKASVKCNL